MTKTITTKIDDVTYEKLINSCNESKELYHIIDKNFNDLTLIFLIKKMRSEIIFLITVSNQEIFFRSMYD